MSKFSVSAASPTDCGSIAAIASASSLSNLAMDRAAQGGFLVGALDESGYRDVLSAGETLLVCRSRGEVIGFLHAYLLGQSTDGQFRSVAETVVSGPAYVIKQVAVHPERRRQGVADLLYDRFMESVEPLPVVAAVVADPPNLPSVRHHRKHGFLVRGEFIGSDGYSKLLFMNPGALQNDATHLRDLIEQYRVATSVYLHEDRTNWIKINNFFYITAGLLAIGGLIIPELAGGLASTSGVVKFAFGGLLGFGIISSFLFFIALQSGIRYLHARKDAAVKLESRIVSLGGSTILGPRAIPWAPHFLRRSPTAKMLVLLPVVVGLAWLAASTAFVVTLLLSLRAV